MGATVTCNGQGKPRVNGRLDMTRSIGDLDLKPYGVIAEPSTKVIKVETVTRSFQSWLNIYYDNNSKIVSRENAATHHQVAIDCLDRWHGIVQLIFRIFCVIEKFAVSKIIKCFFANKNTHPTTISKNKLFSFGYRKLAEYIWLLCYSSHFDLCQSILIRQVEMSKECNTLCDQGVLNLRNREIANLLRNINGSFSHFRATAFSCCGH